jgi:hypothetical protein
VIQTSEFSDRTNKFKNIEYKIESTNQNMENFNREVDYLRKYRNSRNKKFTISKVKNLIDEIYTKLNNTKEVFSHWKTGQEKNEN